MRLQPTSLQCVRIGLNHNATVNLTLSVVEPSIRMSWIEEHWDEGYITKSKKIILDLVSLDLSAPST